MGNERPGGMWRLQQRNYDRRETKFQKNPYFSVTGGGSPWGKKTKYSGPEIGGTSFEIDFNQESMD